MTDRKALAALLDSAWVAWVEDDQRKDYSQVAADRLIAAGVSGEVWLLDWKTSKSVAWPSGIVYADLKLQLAAYARAEFIARAGDSTRHPIVLAIIEGYATLASSPDTETRRDR